MRDSVKLYELLRSSDLSNKTSTQVVSVSALCNDRTPSEVFSSSKEGANTKETTMSERQITEIEAALDIIETSTDKLKALNKEKSELQKSIRQHKTQLEDLMRANKLSCIVKNGIEYRIVTI